MRSSAVVGLKYTGGNENRDVGLFQRESLADAGILQITAVLLFLCQAPMRGGYEAVGP